MNLRWKPASPQQRRLRGYPTRWGSDWVNGRGPVPQLIRFLMKCGFRWPRRYAGRQIRAAREAQIQRIMISEALRQGGAVVGIIDDEGQLQIYRAPGGPEEREE